MTIYSGQVQVTRFKVLRREAEKKKPVPFATINEAAAGWKSQPLASFLEDAPRKGSANLTVREITTGWVAPEGIAAVREWRNGVEEAGFQDGAESSWDVSFGAVNDGIMLRMRIDRRRVPAPLVQALYKQQLNAEEKGKGGRKKRLPRTEKDALKQHVRDTLIGRALPTFAFVDAFWREAAGELLVFTTSEPALKAFEELFARTFGGPLEASLMRIQPPMTAVPDGFWANGKTVGAEVDQWLANLSETIPASVGVADLGENAGA